MPTLAPVPDQKRDAPTAIPEAIPALPKRAASEHPLLHLQRTIGNQAVLRMLRAQGRLSSPAAAEPAAEPYLAPALQAKLTINQPGDRYEQEADRTADHVMRMAQSDRVDAWQEPHGTGLQRACACGGTCSKCKAKNEAEDEPLQRASGEPAALDLMPAPPIVDQVLRSPGQPLDPQTLAFMEPRFGRDFSSVRIHTDPVAEQSAQAVNALAYTVGRNIVFGAGQYAPETDRGKHLMAHELTHVVQQANAEPAVQRWEACAQANATTKDCPPRERGELDEARTGPMGFFPNLERAVAMPAESALIYNFDVGKSDIKHTLAQNPALWAFLESMNSRKSYWKLAGVTDCHGEGTFDNTTLRKQRADALYNALPSEFQQHITSREGAEPLSCVKGNYNAGVRRMNRSVVFLLERSTLDIEGEEIVIADHMHDCRSFERSSGGQVIKTFPFRPTRAGAANIYARREGNNIVVNLPGTSLDFPELNTLPSSVFETSGLSIPKDEIVRVREYQPPDKWYKGATGETDDDQVQDTCMTAEQLLDYDAKTKAALWKNVKKTAKEAWKVAKWLK